MEGRDLRARTAPPRSAGRCRIALLAALILPAPLAGQVHHSRTPTAEAVRLEYLNEVSKGIQETVTRLRAAVASKDVDHLARLFVDGALYSPSTGESHYGIEAIRAAFRTRLGLVGQMLLTKVDFTASGNIAYQFGRYTYAAGPDGRGREEGTYVLVLYQAGRDWKIRSLVERENTL